MFVRTSSLLLLLACGTDDPKPTDTDVDPDTDSVTTDTDTDTVTETDTTVPPETTRACADTISLTAVEGGCLGYADQWDFKADIMGCATTAVVNMWDTAGASGWDEQHQMFVQVEGPEGTYQSWALGPLPQDTPQESWQTGKNSVFDCVEHASALTFAVRMYDGNGALTDCWLWGNDPAAVLGGSVTAVNSDPASAFASCEPQSF